jgi:flagellar hook-associated protein 2
MAISSPGIGSGLDVNNIVSGLMAVEQRPLSLVTTQKTNYQAEISAYGTLKSSLSAFQTSVSALSTASKFNAQTVSSGNSAVFTATASGSATIGDYAVKVSQLASSQKLASAGFTDIASVIGTGTMTINFGTYDSANNSFSANSAKDAVNITIDSSNNTLGGVRDAINASNSSVSASIINNGTSSQLVITSKDTGAVNSLQILIADNDGTNIDKNGLSQLAFDPTAPAGFSPTAGSGKNMTQVQTAQNAMFEVDGIAVTKASNTVTDVIEGVTLNLLASSSGNSVKLAVSSDQATVKASITAFVDAYNKLDTSLRSLTNYDPTGKASGKLLGDATTRNVISQLKQVMTKAITTNGSLTVLSQVGVTFQRDGKLGLDASKLDTAFSSNFADIAGLFSATAIATDPQISYNSSNSNTQVGTYAVVVTQVGSSTASFAGTINGVAATGNRTSLTGAIGDASEGLVININGSSTGARGTVNFSQGYASQLDSLISSFLDTEGVIASRTEGLTSSITRLDKQAESITARLVSIEARYRAQFTRLDTLLSSMSTTSSFLTQQIASMNANR